MILEKGNMAPLFDLPGTPDDQLSLADLKGKRIILAFYPADWSPQCSDQMSLYNEVLDLFKEYNAVLVGISVDSRWSHKAFATDRNLNFPLLSDFEPKGALSRAYGVYNDTAGESERALFIIDEDGIIQWSYLADIDETPGADGILDSLEQLSNKKNIKS